MHDLLISGGTVVDGSGAPARTADVAIADGRIVAVGRDLGPAKATLAADGALVTPGFVDVHSHYDGQASWDEEMLPSSIHGVTTVAMGSCGVGFAPCRVAEPRTADRADGGRRGHPRHRAGRGPDLELGDLPRVHGRARIAGATRSMLAFHVPHDAVRVFAMGERALAGEVATTTTRWRGWASWCGEAIVAGAIGFSTGRTDNHRGKDGRPTPGADASAAELQAIARALIGLDRGVLQAVSDFDMFVSPDRFDPEFDLLEDMAKVAGRPLSISLLQRVGGTEQWRRILARIEQANAAGTPIRAQVATRGIGVHPRPRGDVPSVHRLPVVQGRGPPAAGGAGRRAAEARGPRPHPRREVGQGRRRRQRGAAAGRQAARGLRHGRDEPVPARGHARLRARSPGVAVRRGDARRQEVARGHLRRAARGRRPPAPVLPDLQLRLGHAATTSARCCATRTPSSASGDGGAHVGTICDVSFGTFLLSHWTRDKGVFTIEQAIHKLSGEPAAWLGLPDRGVLAPGRRADVNLIDLPALALRRPELLHDLPAGGKRFLQRATGYRATLVNGEVIAADGVVTGARPGRVARSA
jgi:N-acyl-D-aspartate/D-glutamate deacylase